MKLSSLSMVKVLLATLTLGLCLGMRCQGEGKSQCAWYLVPDLDRIDNPRIAEGMIPVCARNFETNKQDCRLQTTLEYAEAHYNKRFRYDDLKIESTGNPRTIASIEYCD